MDIELKHMFQLVGNAIGPAIKTHGAVAMKGRSVGTKQFYNPPSVV